MMSFIYRSYFHEIISFLGLIFIMSSIHFLRFDVLELILQNTILTRCFETYFSYAAVDGEF